MARRLAAYRIPVFERVVVWWSNVRIPRTDELYARYIAWKVWREYKRKH